MRSQLKLALVIAAIAPLVLSAQRPSGVAANDPSDPPGTFSILGFDPETGEIGAAVQSRVFSVGNGVLWAEAGVGAVATQAVVDVSYGPQGLALLKQGMAPTAIIKKIYDADPDPGLSRRRVAEGGPAVRGDEREGRGRGVHGPEGTDGSRRRARQVLHRAGQHAGTSGRRVAAG